MCVYVLPKASALSPLKTHPYVCVHSPWVNIWNSEDSPSALEWIREWRDCPWQLCTSQGLGGLLCVGVCTSETGVHANAHLLCVCLCGKQPNCYVGRGPKNVLVITTVLSAVKKKKQVMAKYLHQEKLLLAPHAAHLQQQFSLFFRLNHEELMDKTKRELLRNCPFVHEGSIKKWHCVCCTYYWQPLTIISLFLFETGGGVKTK